MPLKTASILTALAIQIIETEEIRKFLQSDISIRQSYTKDDLYKQNILPMTATMTVDERNMHPFGKLSGGASLAMAECLAGFASRLFCLENEFPSGLQVSGSHIASASKGENLLATAKLIHKGKKTHIWDVEITNSQARLISSVKVTNMIIQLK